MSKRTNARLADKAFKAAQSEHFAEQVISQSMNRRLRARAVMLYDYGMINDADKARILARIDNRYPSNHPKGD